DCSQNFAVFLDFGLQLLRAASQLVQGVTRLQRGQETEGSIKRNGVWARCPKQFFQPPDQFVLTISRNRVDRALWTPPGSTGLNNFDETGFKEALNRVVDRPGVQLQKIIFVRELDYRPQLVWVHRLEAQKDENRQRPKILPTDGVASHDGVTKAFNNNYVK